MGSVTREKTSSASLALRRRAKRANIRVRKMSSRLRKQNRLFCGHCSEYLSRATFWKHHKAFYDVKNECWTTKENSEKEAKRARHDFVDPSLSDSSQSESGDEELEAAISTEGMSLMFNKFVRILGSYLCAGERMLADDI